MKIFLVLLWVAILQSLGMTQSKYLLDVNTSPTVKERNAEFSFYMELNTNRFDSIVILAPSSGGDLFTLDGLSFTQFTLFDNGSHGDLMAGDRIYTRNGLNFDNPLTTWGGSQIVTTQPL